MNDLLESKLPMLTRKEVEIERKLVTKLKTFFNNHSKIVSLEKWSLNS